MEEVWKSVPGYEGIYEVSDQGRVKSLARETNNQYGKTDIIMSPGWSPNGYYFVTLCKNGVHKNARIHRLVAEAFIPNPGGLPQVNHKDCDRSNNKAENLEWCTAEYNINYADRNKKAGVKSAIPVFQYTKCGEFVKRYDSAVQAEKETGIASQNISKCRAGKLPSAGGFVWKYA